MSVMGCILTRVFDEEHEKPSGTPAVATASGNRRSVAQGPLTFPEAVDIEAILTRIAARHKEKLNWRVSIVDLLKLVHLDSSLASRRELADELGYVGCADDSAAMNSWLHRQVMQKLRESNPKVLNSYLDAPR